MEYYQQKRLLVSAIVLLVLLNVGAMGMIWQDKSRKRAKPPQQRHQSYENGIAFLQEELNLTEEQTETFRRLRREHFDNVRQIGERLREVKRTFFQNMTSVDREDDNIKALANEVGELNAKRDMELFAHFQDLKAVCDEQQQQRLGEIFQEFMRKSAPRPGGLGGPPRQGPRQLREGGPPPHPQGDMPPPRQRDF